MAHSRGPINDLKPCPFCGSTDVGGAAGIITCYGCKAESGHYFTTDDAAVVWNRRAATVEQATRAEKAPNEFRGDLISRLRERARTVTPLQFAADLEGAADMLTNPTRAEAENGGEAPVSFCNAPDCDTLHPVCAGHVSGTKERV